MVTHSDPLKHQTEVGRHILPALDVTVSVSLLAPSLLAQPFQLDTPRTQQRRKKKR